MLLKDSVDKPQLLLIDRSSRPRIAQPSDEQGPLAEGAPELHVYCRPLLENAQHSQSRQRLVIDLPTVLAQHHASLVGYESRLARLYQALACVVAINPQLALEALENLFAKRALFLRLHVAQKLPVELLVKGFSREEYHGQFLLHLGSLLTLLSRLQCRKCARETLKLFALKQVDKPIHYVIIVQLVDLDGRSLLRRIIVKLNKF